MSCPKNREVLHQASEAGNVALVSFSQELVGLSWVPKIRCIGGHVNLIRKVPGFVDSAKQHFLFCSSHLHGGLRESIEKSHTKLFYLILMLFFASFFSLFIPAKR